MEPAARAATLDRPVASQVCRFNPKGNVGTLVIEVEKKCMLVVQRWRCGRRILTGGAVQCSCHGLGEEPTMCRHAMHDNLPRKRQPVSNIFKITHHQTVQQTAPVDSPTRGIRGRVSSRRGEGVLLTIARRGAEFSSFCNSTHCGANGARR